MKWNEKSNLQKTVLVVSLVLVAADWTLFILDVLGVLSYNRSAEVLLRAAFCFGFGFASFVGKKVLWYAISAYSIFQYLLHRILSFL